MMELLKHALAQQYNAALDMFENALRACPDPLWEGQLWADAAMPADFSRFWYVAYHNLFWLDFYLSGADPTFIPPAPFTLSELDPAGQMPERTYACEELLAYLAHCRKKAQTMIGGLDDTGAARVCRFTWGEMSYLSLLLDTLRHIQEHGAQLHMFLGQQTAHDTRWVTKS